MEPPLLNNELNSKSSNILNYVYVLNQFHFEGTVVKIMITGYLFSENISYQKQMNWNEILLNNKNTAKQNVDGIHSCAFKAI